MNVINYNSIPETDWARLAAFTDGEGCLFIDFRRESVSGVGNKTNYSLPLWLLETFGGTVSTRNASGKYHDHIYYTWSAGHKLLPVILPRMMPWLVIKREQAKVLLEFVNTLNPKRGRYYRTPATVLDIREALAKKSSYLKEHPQQKLA